MASHDGQPLNVCLPVRVQGAGWEVSTLQALPSGHSRAVAQSARCYPGVTLPESGGMSLIFGTILANSLLLSNAVLQLSSRPSGGSLLPLHAAPSGLCLWSNWCAMYRRSNRAQRHPTLWFRSARDISGIQPTSSLCSREYGQKRLGSLRDCDANSYQARKGRCQGDAVGDR